MLRWQSGILRRRADTAQAEVTRLEDEVDDLSDQVDSVTVDAKGNLGNPPNDGVRSGIGLISGWVCAANSVQIRISAPSVPGFQTIRLNAAYGTSRPDVPENENSNCDNADAGFGMTYNFNHLPEGTYTIGAYADGLTRIGATRTFEVVHLVDFAAIDDDRFLRGLKG